MKKFSLSIRILTGLVFMAFITIFAQQTNACNTYSSRNIMLSQNEQNMDHMNMNHMNMDHMNMNTMPERVQKGYAISPVSHTQVKITANTPFVIYADRKYYFVSEQEKNEFLKDPQKYINNMTRKKVNNPHPGNGM